MSAMQLPSASHARSAARAGRTSGSVKPFAAVRPRAQNRAGRCTTSTSAVAAPAVATSAAATSPAPTTLSFAAERDLNARHRMVKHYFPTALGVDDWMSRVEAVLAAYGFAGDNSIACTNLCRDEVTAVLKDKIEAAFGSSFNTNGLGGVLTCGATGMGAGLSHSPICDNGRERYVFFSFPHIAINSQGEVGAISRPGRAGKSCACGALAKALGELKKEGVDVNCKQPGVHEPLDPEYSILKQRLARRMRDEGTKIEDLTLASITAIAERTITSDLEGLIEKAVDLSKADYAVVTGVQIHNWSTQLVPGGAPSMEFVAPTRLYVVIQGEKIELDMTQVPSLSPRQLKIMASASVGEKVDGTEGSTLQEIPLSYLVKQLGGAAMAETKQMMPMEELGKTERWQAAVEGRPGAQPALPPIPARAPAPAAKAPAPAPAAPPVNTSFSAAAYAGSRMADVPAAVKQPAAAKNGHSAPAAAAPAPAAPAAAAPQEAAKEASGNGAAGEGKSSGGFWAGLKTLFFGPGN